MSGSSSTMRPPIKLLMTGLLSGVLLCVFFLASSPGPHDLDLPHHSYYRNKQDVNTDHWNFQEEQIIADDVADDLADTQPRRQRRIREVCRRSKARRRHGELDPQLFRNLFVDDKNKFIYCEVPKVACTNWKRIMLVLSGKVNTTDPSELSAEDVHTKFQHKYLRRLSYYSPEEIQQKIDTYYKFMFARNPLERILSAYKNKFTLHYNEYFHHRYGRKIVRRYRDNPSERSLDKGDDVTFQEFVTYLLDPTTAKSEPLNAHWRQFYMLCHPCIVKYSFIGKYETLSQDIARVLRDLHVDDKINFPAPPKIGKRPKTMEILRSSYTNISSEEIHKLWEMYSVDYALFGYEYPDIETHY